MGLGARSRVPLGRYELHGELASGGMACVCIGTQIGAIGFSRLVAIKRPHAQYANAPEFVAMFLDEARLAARVRHPNVVTTIDVVHEGSEVFLVMEYVEGESLAGLGSALRDLGEHMPLSIASSVVTGMLHGLHAAHMATAPDGAPLGIVHRDVSPHNVLVGTDGVARVVDFGIALANSRLQITREGQLKGKLAYVAPEQITREHVTAASDVYAAGLVLWELCAGRRAFQATNEAALLGRVLTGAIPRLDEIAPWVDADLAEVTHRALAIEPSARYRSAHEMALALEETVRPAPAHEVGAFVERVAADALRRRRRMIAAIERGIDEEVRAEVAATVSRIISGSHAAAPPPRSSTPESTGTSLTTDPAAPLRRARWRGAALVIPLAAAAAVGAVVWRAGRAGSTAAAPEVLSATSPEPSAQAPPAAPPEPPTATAAEPSASVGATSSALPAESAVPRAPAAGRAHAPKAPTRKDPCDPPYYVDSTGIQRVKRDCFGR